MKRLLYSFALVLFAGSSVMAQGFPCQTDYYHQQLVEKDPTLIKDLNRLIANSYSAKSDDSTVYTIPVVFHILHQNGPENIPDANIFDAMAVLNRDYAKENPDTAAVHPEYEHLVSNAKIKFKLASYDPWGNCTNGINRIYTHETKIGDAASKLNQWDRSRYLNVWVVGAISSGAAGYSHYPTDVNGYSYWIDGVVILNTYLGRLSPSSEYTSRALTHEVGHWLSLPHVWGSNNDPTIACGDDGINDTPRTKGHNNCTVLTSIVCDVNQFTNAVYDFKNVTTTTGSTDTTAPPSQVIINDTRIEFSNFKAVGVSTNSLVDSTFAFSGWGTGAADGETSYANLTGAVNTGKYYEFTVNPNTLQGMTLTDITFKSGRNDDGVRTFVVRSSVDNYATNLNASVIPATNTELGTQTGNIFFLKNDVDTLVAGATITLTGAAYTNRYNPVTFRVYGYNAEGTAGTLAIDDVKVNGTFGTIENVQNYLEYSYCSMMFTHGQRDVMRHALVSTDGRRNNLITDATHTATGIDLTTPPVCIPKPDIKANKRNVCVGQSVVFTDQSYNGPVTIREWVFEDGTPATSTAANPSVVFNTYGVKAVTLTVGNASGQVTETFTEYIDVQPEWAAYTGPKSFDMESTNYQELRLVNDGENYGKFDISNVGFNSNRSMKLTTYKNISSALPSSEESRYYQNLGGQVDAIITPTFDLRNTTGVNFSFDYSYATNAVTTDMMSEVIKVYYSRNCGETWIPLGTPTQAEIKGAALASAGFAGSTNFSPASDSDWKNWARPLNTTSADNRTRFKIEFTASDYSNNLFIDNIMVTGTLGLTDEFTSEHELIIAPNPVVSGNDLNIQYVAGNEPVTFTLRNLQGEAITTVVRNEVNQPVSFGLEINKNIAAAYYFLEVKSATSSTVKKIAVIK